jgi:hypothetical protein
MREALHKALINWFGDQDKNDRYRAGRLLQRSHTRASGGQDHVRREFQQFSAELLSHLDTNDPIAKVDLEVVADHPTQSLQLFFDGRDPGLYRRIPGGTLLEPADAAHAFSLLRPRNKRPKQCAQYRAENSRRLMRLPRRCSL